MSSLPLCMLSVQKRNDGVRLCSPAGIAHLYAIAEPHGSQVGEGERGRATLPCRGFLTYRVSDQVLQGA